MNQDNFSRLTKALLAGGTAVVRTDTLYGVIALADNESAVEKVYIAKGRDTKKQCIVLLSDASEAPLHGDLIEQLDDASDSPLTVIVSAAPSTPSWLLRGGQDLAYRVVRNDFLREVIRAVGPVIAPSANPEGLPPAHTLQQAQEYFGDAIDVYIDGGNVPQDVQASTIVKINHDGSVVTLRA